MSRIVQGLRGLLTEGGVKWIWLTRVWMFADFSWARLNGSPCVSILLTLGQNLRPTL